MVVQLSCSLTCNWQQPWYLVQVHCSDTFYLVFHCYIFLLLSVFLLLSSFVDCSISFLYRKQLKFKTIPTINDMFKVHELLFYFCISILPLATLLVLNIFIFYLFLRVWDLPLWCYKQLHYKSSYKFSISGISQNYCCPVFLW